MATITYWTDKFPAITEPRNGVITATTRIDFSKKNAAASDVVQCINMPANSVLLRFSVRIVTAEGATCTGDFGYTGDDPNGFDDAVNLNAAAGTITQGTVGTDADMSDPPKSITAADTLDLVLDNAAATAVIEVTAVYYISSLV